MTWTVIIPDWHPVSVNVLLGASFARGRGARFAAAKRKRQDAEILAAYCHAAGVPKAKGPRVVRLTIGLAPRQRACDSDNYMKSLLDGLRKCGAIVDDSPKWCRVEWAGTTRGVKETVVVIEGLG
jgi:Holliday junction resolvase RusA-like endonuclease